MPDPRPLHERVAARLATGSIGHLVCGLADWADLVGRHLLAVARRKGAAALNRRA